jgi:hypothetical protein
MSEKAYENVLKVLNECTSRDFPNTDLSGKSGVMMQ